MSTVSPGVLWETRSSSLFLESVLELDPSLLPEHFQSRHFSLSLSFPTCESHGLAQTVSGDSMSFFLSCSCEFLISVTLESGFF